MQMLFLITVNGDKKKYRFLFLPSNPFFNLDKTIYQFFLGKF
jgi:hypothetical protein